MLLEHDGGHFRLEITSIEEFAHFVAIIRAEELDAEALNALTARLNKKSAALKAAEQGATNAKPNIG
jgi:uncharacterized protein YdgA (DUF945 family)